MANWNFEMANRSALWKHWRVCRDQREYECGCWIVVLWFTNCCLHDSECPLEVLRCSGATRPSRAVLWHVLHYLCPKTANGNRRPDPTLVNWPRRVYSFAHFIICPFTHLTRLLICSFTVFTHLLICPFAHLRIYSFDSCALLLISSLPRLPFYSTTNFLICSFYSFAVLLLCSFYTWSRLH